MATYPEIKEFVKKNTNEILKEDYWSRFKKDFKSRSSRQQHHYFVYHEDFGSARVWAHCSDKGVIVSIHKRFFEGKNEESNEALKAFFEEAAKDKALAEAMEKEAMEMEEE